MRREKESANKGRVFLAGKGFYVVLFACVAIIGMSAWILFYTGDIGDSIETIRHVEGEEPAVSSPTPVKEREPVFPPAQAGEGASSPQIPTRQEPHTPAVTAPAVSPAVETTAKPPQELVREETREETPPPPSVEKALDELTFVWPVSGKVEMPFSVDVPVYNRTLSVWQTHAGIDIASPTGTKILAVTDGTVADVYEDDLMGVTVAIDHGNGLRSIYSNLAGTPVVRAGDNVTMGAAIGAVGDTALGEIGEVAHVHLEMTLNGDVQNPEDYLPTR